MFFIKSFSLQELKDEALQGLLGKLSSMRSSPEVPRLLPEASASGQVESFDGTPIYWERHDPVDSTQELGCPIVFCYGLVCSMNQWRFQVERYRRHHPCLLLDYRGHHKSGFPKDAKLLNLSAIAKDVSAAIRAQGFDEACHVWGHSMGVNVALELAASEPELCQSLNLCCGTLGNPFADMFNTDVLEKLTSPLLKDYPRHADLYHLLWRIALAKPELSRVVAGLAGFNDKASTKEDMDAYVKAVANIDPKVFFPLLTEMTRGLTRGLAPKIQTPTLVIAGASDHITPPKAQRELAETMPKARYLEVPAGSHNVQLDFGEYVCMKAEEFWKEHNLC